jgi:hypothetical protein
MRYFISLITIFSWALWLGGMVALVLFVSALFARDRAVALEAAPRLFVIFGTYQLIISVVAIAAACTWRLIEKRRALSGIIVMLILAGCGAVLLSTMIVPPMEKLRAEGQRESVEFKQLHKRSTRLYLAEMLALIITGCMLPAAMRFRPPGASRSETDQGIAEAPETPDAAADSVQVH